MSTHPQGDYQDPLARMIKAEERTCKGCRWRRMVEGALQCTNPRIDAPHENQRCKEYEERE